MSPISAAAPNGPANPTVPGKDPTGFPGTPPTGPVAAVTVKPAVSIFQRFWNAIRSNVYFVAFEGGASGAAMNYIYDGLTTGKLDFSLEGIRKLTAFAVIGGITAARLLMRPAPQTPPSATSPKE